MTILERTPASGPAAPPPAERRAGPSRRSGAALLGRLVAPGLATAGQLAQAAFTLVGASVIIWLLSAVSPVDPAQRVVFRVSGSISRIVDTGVDADRIALPHVHQRTGERCAASCREL